MFALTERLAAVATAPGVEVAEFLCREVLNRALRNPDNHLRNTSVQQLPDGTVRLAPLYDLAPMYLDQELITRTCAWNGPGDEVLRSEAHPSELQSPMRISHAVFSLTKKNPIPNA